MHTVFSRRVRLRLRLRLHLHDRLRLVHHGRRPLSASSKFHFHQGASQVRGLQSVTVPCRSNGSIRLNVLPPPSSPSSASSSSSSSSSSPILLYLPAGPLVPDHARPDHDAQIVAALSAASGATLVCINYRLDKDHRYPIPVHDVLTAWDWVLHNLVDSPSSCLGVCGELLGANLAATLALTECHERSPGVVAAALNNPLVDWILPPDLVRRGDDADDGEDDDRFLHHLPDLANVSPPPGRGRRKHRSSWDMHGENPALPTAAMTRARAAFFHNQDGYFDSFASPIHFLRTPGLAFTAPAKSDDDFASQWDEQDAFTIASPYHGLRATVSPRRRSYRMYPPTGMGLRLPAMRVSAGEASPLRDQADELVRLVQRSVKHDNDGSRDEALNRCSPLSLRPGLGLWSGAHRARDWRGEVEAVGKWFRHVLAQDDGKQYM